MTEDRTAAATQATAEIPVAGIGLPAGQREHDPRKVKALWGSVLRHGLLCPILVRVLTQAERATPAGYGVDYEVVAGAGRLLAFRLGGRATIPARVLAGEPPPEAVRQMRFAENRHRQQLRKGEEIDAIFSYMRDFNCSQAEVAQAFEIDPSTVSRYKGLLERLPKSLFNASAISS